MQQTPHGAMHTHPSNTLQSPRRGRRYQPLTSPVFIALATSLLLVLTLVPRTQAHALTPQPVHIQSNNPFPYGQCTWWADQRTFELHGSYVPWTTNANAWQWVTRASEYHWHISETPEVGSIIVLQPFVQGAYAQGHVGIVERILPASIITSNMNWGTTPNIVTFVLFSPGPGVTFLSR